MLDIIITHHKERWDVCRKFFWMLDLQRRVDWSQIRVTIINDGGQRLPDAYLNELDNFRVEQIDIPHGGISAARNAGIDHGTEPWIMFCDCDDCFSNIYALEDIMTVIQPPAEEQYDVLWAKCWEEDEINGGPVYIIPDKKVFVFIHGKIYRRQFLLDEGIRFDEDLSFNEDSCFNAVIMTRTPNTRIGEITTHAPVYTWIRRKSSVTTGAGAEDKGAYGQFRRNMKVTEETRVHRPAEYAGMVARTVYDTYYMTHGRTVSPACKEGILAEFIPWARERAELFRQMDLEMIGKIRAISRWELLEPDEDIDGSFLIVCGWLDNITKEE